MVLYLLIVVGLVLIDQITKLLVVVNMDLHQSITIIPNFFYLSSHRNTGAAWGILQGQMWFFYLVTAVVICILGYILFFEKQKNMLYLSAIILMLSGAIGNFIDRIFNQSVVDFFNFYIFGYDFPVFNFADIYLTIGTVIFAIDVFLDLFSGWKNGNSKV